MATIVETGPDTRNLVTRLWRNHKARSVIIQIVTLTVTFAALALILRNVVINLETVGKEFSFSFLLYPAGYDITFSPFIEYSSRSTHLRAAVVGILNTLLVAVCGIVPTVASEDCIGVAWSPGALRRQDVSDVARIRLTDYAASFSTCWVLEPAEARFQARRYIGRLQACA